MNHLKTILPEMDCNTLLPLPLFLAGSMITGISLSFCVRGLPFDHLFWIIIWGICTGYLFSRLAITGKWLIPWMLSSGLAVILLLNEVVVDSLGQLIITIIGWGDHFHSTLLINNPDLSPIAKGIDAFASSIFAMINRSGIWVRHLISGSPIYDSVGITIFWGLILWCTVWWGIYAFQRRYSMIVAMLPMLILMSGALAYTDSKSYGLAPLQAITLLLIIIRDYGNKEYLWEKSSLDFSLDIRTDQLAAAVILTITLTGAALTISSISIKDILDQIRKSPEQSSQTTAKSLGLESQSTKEVKPQAIVSLPQQHLIGSGPELSKKQIMRIEVNRTNIDGYSGTPPAPPRYYWRGLMFDTYTGTGWETDTIKYSHNQAGHPLYSVQTNDQTITQRVDFVSTPLSILYYAGNLVKVDQPFTILTRSHDDTYTIQIKTSSYKAISTLPKINAVDLAAQTPTYPDWITERYLQLPSSISNRVKTLASQITAQASTPYEKARAIESYLRQYPYTLDLPTPPANHEISDYFLFDLKRGYCDYFSTTMVVMARLVGLPSRLVVGYAPGHYDPSTSSYLITAADAHSWPEIYFPNTGWVNFEPTSGRPEIGQTIRSENQELPPPPPSLHQNPLWESIHLPSITWILIIIVICLFSTLSLTLLWITAQSIWILSRPPATGIQILYNHLLRSKNKLGLHLSPGCTPMEVAYAYTQNIEEIIQNHKFIKYLNPVDTAIMDIIRFYNLSQYSPRPIKKQDVRRSIWHWQIIFWSIQMALIHIKIGNLIYNKRQR